MSKKHCIRSNGFGHLFRKISIHLNGWAHPFKKCLDPFEQLRSAIQKKLATLQTAQFTIQKSLLIRSNGLSHPFKTSLYLFERLESSAGPFRKNTNVIHSFARTAQFLFRENLHPFGLLQSSA